jgi:hypothetical protein
MISYFAKGGSAFTSGIYLARFASASHSVALVQGYCCMPDNYQHVFNGSLKAMSGHWHGTDFAFAYL